MAIYGQVDEIFAAEEREGSLKVGDHPHVNMVYYEHGKYHFSDEPARIC